MAITLRPATPADADLLKKWDNEPHVLAGDPNDEWGWDVELHRSPPWREHLIAELDGRPIGFMEMMDPQRDEEQYWGDCPPNLRTLDIWIGEAWALNKGYGTEMMRQALARCFANPRVDAVIIDPLESNTRAHRFYERFGFRFVERRRFGLDDCYVMRLDRIDYEARPGAGG